MQSRLQRARHGLTLVEILVVIGIIVAVAAVILPSIKSMLKDQKISQAARQLQGFIESAKAQAQATNRPVGVAFERLEKSLIYPPGSNTTTLEDNSTCIQVSRVEVPPPYCGDFQGAEAWLTERTTTPASNNGCADIAYLPTTYAGSVLSLVREGDYISFGDNPTRYYIESVTANQLFPHKPNLGTNCFTIAFRNRPGDPPYTAEQIPLFGKAFVSQRFRVYRKPIRLIASVLQLPKGICIDLSCSGQQAIRVGSPPDFSIDNITGLPNPPAGDFLYAPVTVLFSPTGDVAEVYYGTTSSPIQARPTSNLYFLLGKTDGVVPLSRLEPFSGGQINDSRDAVQGNLMNPDNMWVTIARNGGRVTTMQLNGVQIPNPATFNLAFRIEQSRGLAKQGITQGGR